MNEYSIIDGRRRSFLILDKAIPLAYAPYIGADSVCLYLLYASLADQSSASIEPDEIQEFLGIDTESMQKCNQTLEEYGLIKLEDHEHNGRIITNCYVLKPPPLPQTLYQDLRKKSLTKYIEDVLEFVPAAPKKSTRTRRSLITESKLISKLYKGIGHSKVDVFEREAGKRQVKELVEKGYSLEDIDFAVEWSLEKAIGQIEDFSSIKDLIGKAIEDREKYMAERTQQAEQEVKGHGEEEIERKMVEAYRKMMPEAEEKRLRQQVLEKIRQDERMNEEFVTEQLLVIMENEIIRKEYLKRGVFGDEG
jgi:hypothetical protein